MITLLALHCWSGDQCFVDLQSSGGNQEVPYGHYPEALTVLKQRQALHSCSCRW